MASDSNKHEIDAMDTDWRGEIKNRSSFIKPPGIPDLFATTPLPSTHSGFGSTSIPAQVEVPGSVVDVENHMNAMDLGSGLALPGHQGPPFMKSEAQDGEPSMTGIPKRERTTVLGKRGPIEVIDLLDSDSDSEEEEEEKDNEFTFNSNCLILPSPELEPLPRLEPQALSSSTPKAGLPNLDFSKIKFPDNLFIKESRRRGNRIFKQFIKAGQFVMELDELNPKRDFTIAEYRACWKHAMDKAWASGGVDLQLFNQTHPGLDLDTFGRLLEAEKRRMMELVDNVTIRTKLQRLGQAKNAAVKRYGKAMREGDEKKAKNVAKKLEKKFWKYGVEPDFDPLNPTKRRRIEKDAPPSNGGKPPSAKSSSIIPLTEQSLSALNLALTNSSRFPENVPTGPRAMTGPRAVEITTWHAEPLPSAPANQDSTLPAGSDAAGPKLMPADTYYDQPTPPGPKIASATTACDFHSSSTQRPQHGHNLRSTVGKRISTRATPATPGIVPGNRWYAEHDRPSKPKLPLSTTQNSEPTPTPGFQAINKPPHQHLSQLQKEEHDRPVPSSEQIVQRSQAQAPQPLSTGAPSFLPAHQSSPPYSPPYNPPTQPTQPTHQNEPTHQNQPTTSSFGFQSSSRQISTSFSHSYSPIIAYDLPHTATGHQLLREGDALRYIQAKQSEPNLSYNAWVRREALLGWGTAEFPAGARVEFRGLADKEGECGLIGGFADYVGVGGGKRYVVEGESYVFAWGERQGE